MTYPYFYGLLHWHRGDCMIAPVPMKQPCGIRVKAFQNHGKIQQVRNVCLLHTQTEMLVGLPCLGQWPNRLKRRRPEVGPTQYETYFTYIFFSCIPNSMETPFRFRANCVVDAISQLKLGMDLLAIYRKVSNIRRTKPQNLNASRLIL